MATAKAKLHTVMARTGKKCRYETWQLPQSEAGSVALEGHPESGLLEFNKQDPMFACKLHLPDGVTIQSSSFRRKKDAEQDAALHALQKVRVDTSSFLDFYSHDRDIHGHSLFVSTFLCLQFSVFKRTSCIEVRLNNLVFVNDTNLATLQMGILYEPGALQATAKESWEGLLHKVSLAFTDQVSSFSILHVKRCFRIWLLGLIDWIYLFLNS